MDKLKSGLTNYYAGLTGPIGLMVKNSEDGTNVKSKHTMFIIVLFATACIMVPLLGNFLKIKRLENYRQMAWWEKSLFSFLLLILLINLSLIFMAGDKVENRKGLIINGLVCITLLVFLLVIMFVKSNKFVRIGIYSFNVLSAIILGIGSMKALGFNLVEVVGPDGTPVEETVNLSNSENLES